MPTARIIKSAVVRTHRSKIHKGSNLCYLSKKRKHQLLWLVLFFLDRRDSKPERARSVKQNSLGNCFVAEWCADGYRKAGAFGSSSKEDAIGGFIPSGGPKKKAPTLVVGAILLDRRDSKPDRARSVNYIFNMIFIH